MWSQPRVEDTRTNSEENSTETTAVILQNPPIIYTYPVFRNLPNVALPSSLFALRTPQQIIKPRLLRPSTNAHLCTDHSPPVASKAIDSLWRAFTSQANCTHDFNDTKCPAPSPGQHLPTRPNKHMIQTMLSSQLPHYRQHVFRFEHTRLHF